MATDVFSLVGRIALTGAKDVKRELTETEQAAKNLGKSTSTMGVGFDDVEQKGRGLGGMLQDNQNYIMAAGSAMTALGAAGIQIVESNQELNTTLSLVGVTLGKTKGEMQDLAISTADAGFPLKEVAATFDVLTKAGIRDTDTLVASSKAFDTLADATGGSADALANSLVPAFKALGMEIPTTNGEMDTLTWMTKNTQVTLDDFASVMNQVALKGQDLGLSMNDMIAVMAALEAKGITGSAATRAFRTALSEATGESDAYKEAMANAEQATKDLETAQGDAQTAASDLADAQNGLLRATEDLAAAQKDAEESTARGEIALQRNSWAHEDLEKKIAKTKKGSREYQELQLELTENELDRTDIMGRMADSQDKVKEAEESAATATAGVTEAQNTAETATGNLATAQDAAKTATDNATAAQAAAEDKLGTLYTALGLTKEEVAAYQGKLGEAEGAAETWGGAADANVTTMDKMKEGFEEVSLKSSGFLGNLEPLMMGISGLGTALVAIPGALKAWKLAQIGLDAVMKISVIGLILTAIAVAAYLIIENWDKIKPFFQRVFQWLEGAFKKVWEVIKAVFWKVVDWIKEWGVLFLGPLGLVIKYHDQIKDALKKVWEKIKEVFWKVIAWVKEWGVLFMGPLGIIVKYHDQILSALKTAWGKITSVFRSAFDKVKEWIASFLSAVWSIPTSIARALSGVYSKITGAFRGAFDKVKEFISGALTKFWGIGGSIKSALSTVYAKVTGAFSGAFTKVKEWVSGLLTKFWSINSSIKKALSKVWTTITAPFKSAIEYVKGKLSSLPGVSWVVDQVTGGSDSGESHASGGLITEPTALVSMRTGKMIGTMAENAPEWIVPMSGARGQGASGGGYQTANIYLVLNGKTLAKAIAVPLVDELRLQTGVRF